jgi:hypothetical protein
MCSDVLQSVADERINHRTQSDFPLTRHMGIWTGLRSCRNQAICVQMFYSLWLMNEEIIGHKKRLPPYETYGDLNRAKIWQKSGNICSDVLQSVADERRNHRTQSDFPLTRHQSESSNIGSYSSGRVESAAPKKSRLPIGPSYVSITCWPNMNSVLL